MKKEGIMRSGRSNLRFLDDLTKVATGALGSFSEIRHQVKKMVKEGVEQMMGEMDMVTRSEFERLEAMAQKARERQVDLEKRVADLEKRLKPKGRKTKGNKK